MSVTMPIFSPLPPPSPPPPQPATTKPMTRPNASRRFMTSSDLPAFRGAGPRASGRATRRFYGRTGSAPRAPPARWSDREDAPDHVSEEDHVEAAAEHEG